MKNNVAIHSLAFKDLPYHLGLDIAGLNWAIMVRGFFSQHNRLCKKRVPPGKCPES